ncbi:hypothetical protein FOMPIDRAFT_9544, partial [Fomitopsis schrenkii]
VLGATLAAPRDAPLHIVLSTKDLINALFKKLPTWEDEGWIGVQGATYLKALVNQLRQRSAPTTFRVASTEEELLAISATRARRDRLRLDNPPQPLHPVEQAAFRLSGARLTGLTQALAYRGIRERTAPPPRNTTTTTIAAAKCHMKDARGTIVEEAEIWLGIKHRDIRRTVVDFLWKSLHGAHRIGKFWLKVPGHEDRARCRRCHEQDSLAHILLECSETGQARVWELTEAALRRKGAEWTPLRIHDILAIGPRSRAPTVDEPPKKHTARLWRILVSESAHLIWRLRCERVIGHSDDKAWQHSTESVTTRWYAAINSRLRQDATSTSTQFGPLTRKRGEVLKTWARLLANEESLPADWTRSNRVL